MTCLMGVSGPAAPGSACLVKLVKSNAVLTEMFPPQMQSVMQAASAQASLSGRKVSRVSKTQALGRLG